MIMLWEINNPYEYGILKSDNYHAVCVHIMFLFSLEKVMGYVIN